MYWQHEYLREAATMTRGQTYRIDLPETGLLSALVCEISADAASGYGLSGGDWRLMDKLGLVEVIGNGATVIKSLQFNALQFFAWLHQGVVPPHFWRNYATNTQFEYCVFLFGRYMKDPDYGLDLSRWDNVELRITNDAAAADHGTDLSIDIKQILLREGPGSFRGYLRSETWREWTTVTDETKYHTLPVEFPISTLALQCIPAVDGTTFIADTSPANLADDIDFKLKGGTRQVFKGGLDHLMVENYLERGANVIMGGQADLTADRGVVGDVGRSWLRAGISGSKDGAVSSTIPTIIADNTDFTVSFEAREADSPVEFVKFGMLPFEIAWLWHNHMLDPQLMLNPQADGPVEVNVHTRNAATADNGTNRLILERLVAG